MSLKRNVKIFLLHLPENNFLFSNLSAACEWKQVEMKDDRECWVVTNCPKKSHGGVESALTKTKTWSLSIINPPYFIFLHEKWALMLFRQRKFAGNERRKKVSKWPVSGCRLQISGENSSAFSKLIQQTFLLWKTKMIFIPQNFMKI